ncbi:MAG: hypothetical protein ACK5HC_17960 [Dolichospermum sp.]
MTGNREQGTGNREQGTGNREQGTGNREQGTGNSFNYLDILNFSNPTKKDVTAVSALMRYKVE